MSTCHTPAVLAGPGCDPGPSTPGLGISDPAAAAATLASSIRRHRFWALVAGHSEDALMQKPSSCLGQTSEPRESSCSREALTP